MSEFIFEILTQEIPARMQEKACQDLKKILQEQLVQANLSFENIESFVTPRRLVVCAKGLPLSQSTQTQEKKGPKIDAPDQAQKGFFQSVNMSPEQCRQVDTGKGIYWMADVVQEGLPTNQVLEKIIKYILNELTFAKSMRWGDKKMTWVRPIDQIMPLFNGQKVEVQDLEIPVKATTSGHRFMGEKEISVTSFEGYKSDLLKNNVIVDSAQRQEIIINQIQKLLEGGPYKLIQDPGLLAEVTGLVEWPHVLKGCIDEQFMVLPKELLIAVCKKHQRYFLAQDDKGNLAPFFLFAAGITPQDGGKTVVCGNERVLRARLSDGLFFFQTDQKKTLQDHLEGLKTRVFHQKLGSMLEKVARISNLAIKINQVTFKLDESRILEAANLCKADLATGLVNEFPELQGIAGKYYARLQNMNEDVALAFEEHYKPQGPNDTCPKNPLSVIIALADKIDTLLGFFSIGEKPTGSKDPFALRRSALGIIRLILENNLSFNLYQLLTSHMEHSAAEVFEFILERFKVMLKDQNIPHDVMNACLNHQDIKDQNLPEVARKVESISHIMSQKEGEVLRGVFSRAANILKGVQNTAHVSPDLFEQQEEKDLFEAFFKIQEASDYTQAFNGLLTLSSPLNAFFDHVTVNDPNPSLKDNRIALLSQIRDFALRFVDFYAFCG